MQSLQMDQRVSWVFSVGWIFSIYKSTKHDNLEPPLHPLCWRDNASVSQTILAKNKTKSFHVKILKKGKFFN